MPSFYRKSLTFLIVLCLPFFVFVAVAQGATFTTLGSTGNIPQGIALDSAGNVYTSNYGSNNVSRITQDGTSSIFGQTGLNPTGLAIDDAGNIYVSNYDINTTGLSKITAAGQSIPAFAQTGPGPRNVVLDSENNIYTANYYTQNVSKVLPNGVSSMIASLGNSPTKMAIDEADNLYVSISPDSVVNRISPTGANTVFGTTTAQPLSLVVDNFSNVYTAGISADAKSTVVNRIRASGGTSTIATLQGYCPVYDMAIDSERNLYLPLFYCNNFLDRLVLKVSLNGQIDVLGTPANGGKPSNITIDREGNLYTSNNETNTVSKIIPAPGEAVPAPPDIPGVPAASPGVERATITVPVNPIDARYGAPATYSVRVTDDTSKSCTVTPPATSCAISGLDAGRPYSFTAQAQLNNWITAPSPTSNTVVPQEEYPLSVKKTGTGGGTVASLPAGIACGATCTAPFLENTEVTLTATPAPGSVFLGWNGAGCFGAGSCQVTMNQAKNVTAVFSETFSLNVSKSGAGSGSVASEPAGIACGPDCLGTFPDGTEVTLIAWADAGSTFLGWSGAGCSGTGTCQVTMTEAKSVSAAFASIPSYALTVERSGSGSGEVISDPNGIACGNICTKDFQENTPVSLTAEAFSGSTFLGWGGACSGLGACQVTMNEAKNVSASFSTPGPAPGSLALNVTKSGSGGGEVTSLPTGIACGNDCSHAFPENSIVSLTADPLPGSEFLGWSGACSGSGACQVTMDQARSVNAAFASNPPDPGFFSLSVLLDGNGQGRVLSLPVGIDCGKTCLADFAENSIVSLVASASPGSEFTGWSGAGCTGNDVCQVTMSEAGNVTAHFSKRFPLQVTLAGSGQGEVMSDLGGIDCQPDCSADFAPDEIVSLIAKPLAGATFLGWSGACSGAGTCQVTMDEVRSVNALFLQNYEISVERRGSGSGRVSSLPGGIDCGETCSGTFPKGSLVLLRAEADSGSRFLGWSGAGCTGKGDCAIEISEADQVTALFEHDISLLVNSIAKKISKKKVAINSRVRVSAQGQIRQVVKKGSRVLCRSNKSVSASGAYTLGCRLKAKIRKELRRKKMVLSMQTTFSAYGQKVVKNNKIRLPRTK